MRHSDRLCASTQLSRPPSARRVGVSRLVFSNQKRSPDGSDGVPREDIVALVEGSQGLGERGHRMVAHRFRRPALVPMNRLDRPPGANRKILFMRMEKTWPVTPRRV